MSNHQKRHFQIFYAICGSSASTTALYMAVDREGFGALIGIAIFAFAAWRVYAIEKELRDDDR